LLDLHHCPGYAGGGGGAGICCKNCRYVICTDYQWWFQQSEGFRRCLTEHEEYHVWQMQWDPKPKRGECRGEPCTTLKHPRGADGWEGYQRECQAYLRMYGCLQKEAPQHSWVRKLWDAIGVCLAEPGFKGFM
jgi:hypothetical protein